MYFAAGMLIVENRKILMVTRKDGKIGIPGGKKEKKETPIRTAVRETYEETGLICTSDHLSYIDYAYTFPDGLFYTFFGAVVAGTLKSEPGSEAFWLELDIFLKNPNIMAFPKWTDWAIDKFGLKYL